MKKTFENITIVLLSAILILLICFSLAFAYKVCEIEDKISQIAPIKANAELRVMCGNYYDYKVVETVDGNVWLINQEFEDGQLVQIHFDTKGTQDIKDDEILFIREI